MEESQNRQTAHAVIDKDKWWDMLSRLINVLRVNIFIVDAQGGIILPPEEVKCGGVLLTDISLGFNLLKNTSVNLEVFEVEDHCLEYPGPYHLHCFALPISLDNRPIAYMVVGPVALNRLHDHAVYQKLAEERGVDAQYLIDQINEVRVVSHIMMDSIIDLLREIIKDQTDRITQSRNHYEAINPESKEISKHFSEVANEIYSTIRIDELLATLLDAALKMTNAECGSILMYDSVLDELSIKASKGIDLEKVGEIRMKLGEGLSGIAAQENRTYFIENQETESDRLKNLLERPEIRQSLIMPIVENNKVYGVLNLHSKTNQAEIKSNMENLQYLTQMLSSAL